MNYQDFLLFAFATLMLNLTPGADMIYVATRSTTQGIKAGVVSALGIAGGCLVHTFAAVLGLSVLIAQSAVAFNVVKFLGVGYLCYLGITSLLSKNEIQPQSTLESKPLKKIFWQGVYTNVLNPKVALFFLAFGLTSRVRWSMFWWRFYLGKQAITSKKCPIFRVFKTK